MNTIRPLVLFASIASLITSALGVNPYIGTPQLAYGDGDYEIIHDEISDFAFKDVDRLRGNVVRALTRKSPYIDVLDGGTIESGISDRQKVVVQERAVLAESLIHPAFELDVLMCGKTGEAAEVGSKEYTFQLETNRGKGPLVCIKGMWSAFKTAYSAAEDSIKKQLIQLNNADVRWTLVDRSGCKVVLKAGESFDRMFSGGMMEIDVRFTQDVGLPDAIPSIKFMQYLARFMREDLLVEPFEGNQSEPILRFIGSQEVIDHLRDDAGVREDHRYMAAGSYDIGKNTLIRYTWEGPYRGIAFGVDPQPLRFNVMLPDGRPDYIPPEIAVDTDRGRGSRPNPEWIRAKYETGLLMGMNSFRKLTPESYTGEGSFKFPSQSVTGELIWKNIEDNQDNVWQDHGRHYYQFSRAYEPRRPHAVCAINYARAQVDFGLTPITDFGDWSSTASL